MNKHTCNVTPKLQISSLRCIEGLARAAREQVRDRERIKTFEAYMEGRSTKAPVLVEAHFERLVTLEKRAHLNCSLNELQIFRTNRQLSVLIEHCLFRSLTLLFHNQKQVFF